MGHETSSGGKAFAVPPEPSAAQIALVIHAECRRAGRPLARGRHPARLPQIFRALILRKDALGALRDAGCRRAGFPPPEQSESFPMPSQCLGLDQQQGVAPVMMEAREQHEQASLVDAKGRAFDGSRGDDELLLKERVLGDQLGMRSAPIARAARPATTAGSCEGTRSTARSERIRTQSSRLVPTKIRVRTARRSTRTDC